MKKLSTVLRILVVLSVMSATVYAQPYLELDISNLNPGVSETVQVDIWVKDMPGSELLTFDVCVHYDATHLDVISMQVNDTDVGGCVNSFFSITVDNDADCMRLGSGIMPGTTCEMVGHEYKLATVVLEALTTEGNTICAKTECQSADGCGLNFNGYVEDEIGQVFQITESCTTFNAPIICVLSIDPPSAMVAAGGAIQFNAMETGDCDAPNYQWSDTCVYGNVDSSGFFTADEEIV